MRRRRVRVHLLDMAMPSVEGVMVRRFGREFHIAVPELLVAAGGVPQRLEDARILAIPRENVAFYEVLR